MQRGIRPVGVLFGAALLATVSCSGNDVSETAANGDEPDPNESVADTDTLPVDGLPVFTEVAAEAGLTETQSDLGFAGEQSQSAAAAVADVNGDGHPDVFLARVGKPDGLYLNDGEGNFTDVAEEAGVAGPTERFGSTAAAFLDIDGDGDLDLFVSGAAAGTDHLYVNDGAGHFTDETATRGLDRPIPDGVDNTQQHGVSVADVNRDGAMDLLVLQWRADIYNGDAFNAAAEARGWAADYVPSPCETAAALRELGFPVPEGTPAGRSALYLNDGTGHFTDVTADYGLALDEVVAFTGVFNDLDGDGWVDLAITGDGCTSRLYRNVQGTRFEDITETAGVGTDENGMGAVVRDIDGDGTADWFITSIFLPLKDGQRCPGSTFSACSGNRLFLNDGTASFTDATDAWGLRDSGWGWGVAVEDLDNDGSPEVVTTNGFRTSGEPDPSEPMTSSFWEDRTRLFTIGAGGELPFVEVGERAGLDDTGVGHALVPFDMDGDGDLDILIAQQNDVPLLYRNDTDAANSWLTVALLDPTRPGNPWGDGARVEIVADEGDDPLVAWIGTTGSYESQRPPVVHRGFGERREPLHSVAVHWPGDDRPQVIEDVELDQHLVVERTTTG